MCKFIFVTGGVVSGLGKGITAASLGRLLKARGLKVSSQKLDPYINVDPGTMSPYQHGEVFVTDDGAETDLDLGHYERFIDENLNKYSNLTTGKVYWNVLQKERKGEYLGSTVQVIPHITNEIKEFIYSAARKDDPDVLICEIGGTVGDIESLPFLEAIRQIGLENDKDDVCYIHVTLVPYLEGGREHKSKPTQHSVKELQGIGIKPDIIVLRCTKPLPEDLFEKIALFCNIDRDSVIENRTIKVLYEVPLMLEKQHMADVVVRKLGLKCNKPDLDNWKKMVRDAKHLEKKVTIGMVGKYVRLHDAYLSVAEALIHGGYANSCRIHIKWVDSESVTEENVERKLGDCDGIIVPGGFGPRGINGMILTARYCRENDVPYLGICLGMQVATIEFARNVAGMKDAHSREFNENSPYKVIDYLPDQNDSVDKGGTLRLGAYECNLIENTLIRSLYGADTIFERHRHRYEFNNEFRQRLIDSGLTVSGTYRNGYIVETVELADHSYYIGVQFHPEFRSRPDNPHPLFRGLVKAAINHKESTYD
ncbi:MAG: CTP synthase [Erysipelotrichaceae bacterium]|nr:CTP synthase [Erysipelotrichaceae bacterium]